jgi:hypothetical protein
MMYPELPEKCDVGITWDHIYDPRDAEKRQEFLKSVEVTIEDAIAYIRKSSGRRDL